MRPIRFRAWDKDENCMRDWENILKIRYGHRQHNIFNDPDFILMQSTGLKDLKGNEIFEGDIVEIELSEKRAFTDGERDIFRIVVYWSNDGFHGQRIDNNSTYSVAFGGSAVLRKEVIGNKFENPELIEQESKA